MPLDHAIVDFCCLSLKLVVELDGAAHAYESQARRDCQRDRELQKIGDRVLRFPNGLRAPTEFVKKIRECIAELGTGSVKFDR
jgi:very-short-patch-repair endonuclease